MATRPHNVEAGDSFGWQADSPAASETGKENDDPQVRDRTLSDEHITIAESPDAVWLAQLEAYRVAMMFQKAPSLSFLQCSWLIAVCFFSRGDVSKGMRKSEKKRQCE